MAHLYDAAIKISYLEGGALAGLSKIVATLVAGSGEAAKLEKALVGLKGAAWGAAGAFAGFEGLKGLWDLAKGSKELLNQQEQLRRNSVSNLDVLRLTADAYDKIGQAVPTATASQFLATVKELRAVTGSPARAEALAPKALMVDALLSNTFGNERHGEYYKLLRSTEMKGVATDPKKLEELTDAAFSYITAFGGKLTAQDFQTFARRGGTAWMNMKPESFGPAAVAMADLGGSSAGTAMMTLQQLQQGTMTLSKQQAATLEKAGLLDMSKTTKTGFGGSRLQLEPGAILGSLQYAGDLAGWVKNVVYPHMMAAAGGNEALFQNMLGKEAPNRNAAKMIEMFGNKGFRDQIAKDLGLAGQVLPIGQAYQSYINTNPVGVEAAYEAQKKSMLQAIGSPIMQAAIPVMQAITTLFEKIGALANANPGAITGIAQAIAALSAAALGGGTAAMLSFCLGLSGAIVGWPVAGAAAVVSGLTALAVMNWPTISTGVQWLIDKLNAFSDTCRAVVSKIGEAISDLWGKIKGWLSNISYTGGGGSYGGAHITNAAWSGGGGGVSRGTFTGDAGGMQPYFKTRLDSLLADAHASGHPLSVFSGYRSQAHQDRLFAASDHSGHWVARHSHHTMGIAADLHGDLAWAHAHAASHGLRFPMPWEKWHIEPSGGAPRLPHGANHGGTVVHNHIHLDGKIIARSTSKHFANAAQYATSVGRQDGRGTFMLPGAEVFA